ncbi:MAG: phosphoribosylglycinamide formyltransferase [Herminiimonas sp.]|nr:phosphoribosylglycinamide formyltransferase [Herminiimonas sp.]
MKTIVILISGRGSNMRAVIEAARQQQWADSIAAVISNRGDAPGLEFAREHGIAAEVVDSRAFATRDAFDAALQEAVDLHAPDLVVLAGFMRILTTAFVEHYAGRMLNIHPSLLPSFAGLATHRQALAAGVKLHGATVHFVTPQLDHGPIIAQAVVPVLEDDTEEILAQRVLEQEHRIYPLAVRWFLDGRLTLENSRVRIAAETPDTST